ncbi:GNAT family N-acetyltransferase [Spirosoma foliorum]|uniref:GNAT family N-acetyltransferase n=1 Tax=Spirosoma foliorum TaxID=2710596 RepID=A0A7G5H0P4_9BACT|nr:GNAT family N-acetyltransferase [Spirosoma foliorum]QMW04686.1 GNAT family N-acetyltransferase [Spirosoma foliorum]
MTIRNATLADLEAIHSIECVCFPENEAASLASFTRRLTVFPNHFWLLETEDKLIGFINGMVTDSDTIQDDMFEQAELHDEQGRWQSVFGLAVSPDYRKQGYAELLVNHLIDRAKQQNRKGITLTCKARLIPYYEKLGFYNAGLSKSAHGGEVWYDMKLDL